MYGPLIADAAERALAAAGIEQRRPRDRLLARTRAPRPAPRAKARRRRPRPDADARLRGRGRRRRCGSPTSLERAEPGQTILVVSAADGCDATVLRTTDRIARTRAADPVAAPARRTAATCSTPPT